jgi:hypothetical protein
VKFKNGGVAYKKVLKKHQSISRTGLIAKKSSQEDYEWSALDDDKVGRIYYYNKS